MRGAYKWLELGGGAGILGADLKANPEIALVVHACDRYRLLFEGFEHFFNRNWPDARGINYYFMTEEIDYSSARFACVKTGRAEWSDRLRAGLERLREPFVIYLQEDMWLNRPVDAALLDGLLAFTLAENPALLKLHSSEVYRTKPTGKIFGGLRLAELDNRHSKFLMSHQASIWRREFLISQLWKNEHPWRNERKGTKRLKRLGVPIFQIDLFAENGKPAINDNPSAELRSEYQAVSVNGALNANAQPFIAELSASPDAALSEYGRRLHHHFVNGLTHDGLPRPKKPGFIKKYFSFLR